MCGLSVPPPMLNPRPVVPWKKNIKGIISFLYITKKYHYMQCHKSVESHCATASNKRLPPLRKTEVAWLHCYSAGIEIRRPLGQVPL